MNETTIPEEEIRDAFDQDRGYTNQTRLTTWLEITKEKLDGGYSAAGGFRYGYLAHAAKHAEEVNAKDDEIKNLHHRIARLSGDLVIRGEQLTAKDAEIERLNAEVAAAREILEEILNYKGGADNALEDEYVTQRARNILLQNQL